MKLKKEHLNGILFILLELIVGILLLVRPVSFTSTIIIGVGVLLMAKGILSILRYFKSSTQVAAKEQSLTKGLFWLLAGWFCAFQSQWFIATFPALTMMYGVSMLLATLGKVQMLVDMLREKKEKWFLYAISAAVSAVCAIVIISNPFSTTAVLWMFSGISLIVEAVLDAVSFVFCGTDPRT